MYKISIIIPIFNVEKYLNRALNSIINQTMDFKDMEVIMVDDCSTDNSRKIIEEYSNKYSNFIGIYHEKNSGCAASPRNTGLKVASGEYIMFLDPDDEYSLDCCEKLYNTIREYDADVAFGRFVYVYDNKKTVEKSYSPYGDDMVDRYSKLDFDVKVETKFIQIKNIIIRRIVYGNELNKKCDEERDIKYVNNINQEPVLLKISPSVWTKIYKKKLIFDNAICFPQFKIGEDLAFVLQTFLKANGIVFLNNFLVCKYFIHECDNIGSLSSNIDFKVLEDGINNLIFCSNLEGFSNEIKIFPLISNILFWFSSWKKSHLTRDENEYLIKKVFELKKSSNINLKIKLLLFFIITYIKFSIVFDRFK